VVFVGEGDGGGAVAQSELGEDATDVVVATPFPAAGYPNGL
jgi:hypothetical protein